MAIYFIQEGGYHMNTQLYTSPKDKSAIMVCVEHHTRDGYRLSYSKEVIKEQLPLKGFIERLVPVEEFNQGSSYIENKVQKDMYIVHEALHSRNSGKIRDVGEWLDGRYAKLIREGKVKLMEHDYDINAQRVGVFTERETISNQQREILQQSENMKKQYPMTPDEAFRVSDDEVYYIMTP